jgi:hypothetical protein
MSGKHDRTKEREAFKVGKPHCGPGRPWIRPMTDEELRAYRAAQPPDNRTPAQILMGEPMTHRSALYAKAFGE